MLQKFVAWAQTIPGAVVTEINLPGNASARVDIDSAEAMGRVTAWDSGAYYAEVLNIETGDTTYSHHGQLQANATMDEQFKPFIQVMKV